LKAPVSTAALETALAGRRAAVFDLDGTLYDTRDFERPALEGVVQWLEQRAGRELPGAVLWLWTRRETARHRPGLFDDLLVTHGLPREWGAECARVFRSHDGSGLARSQSLRPLLDELRRHGCRLALASNGRAELQRRKLVALGMRESFDRCVFCEPDRPHELKPGGFAWRELDAWRGDDVPLYVGDDPVDERFAAAEGVPFFHFQFRSTEYAD
jgi:FMN phosphatase YigB (HAD superfamily)